MRAIQEVEGIIGLEDILIEGGAKVSQDTLFLGVEVGDPDLILLFLNKRVLVDGDGTYTHTPLQKALLLLAQAVENKESGAAPITEQELEERKRIVQILVVNGASMKRDLLAQVKNVKGLEDIVKLLRDYGATT